MCVQLHGVRRCACVEKSRFVIAICFYLFESPVASIIILFNFSSKLIEKCLTPNDTRLFCKLLYMKVLYMRIVEKN